MFTSVSVFVFEVSVWKCVPPCRPASAHSFSTRRPNLVLTHGIPPALRGGVFYLYHQPPSSQSQVISRRTTITYRCCPISRVRRHRASSPQGSSTDGCYRFRYHPWTIYCAPLFSHAQYWYCSIICVYVSTPATVSLLYTIQTAILCVSEMKNARNVVVCFVEHIARVGINRVRMPILLVVS